jgi:hypothetical protein
MGIVNNLGQSQHKNSHTADAATTTITTDATDATQQQPQQQLPIADVVRNLDGTLSPVVHQYKNNDALAAHVSINVTDKLLVEWTNQYVLSTIKHALGGGSTGK